MQVLKKKKDSEAHELMVVFERNMHTINNNPGWPLENMWTINELDIESEKLRGSEKVSGQKQLECEAVEMWIPFWGLIHSDTLLPGPGLGKYTALTIYKI